MDDLNYHHLRYFWIAAREGSITAASEHLGLAQPTVSAQIRSLEAAIGSPLFHRTGRRLVLTETGRLVHAYAEQIFSIGRELQDTLAQRPVGGAARLRVGVTDGVPKLVASRLLAPLIAGEDPPHLVVEQDTAEALIARLPTYGLDLVLSDVPLGSELRVRGVNHELGACGIGLFAARDARIDAGAGEADLARALEGRPMVLPAPGHEVRRSLDRWLQEHDVRPRVVAEIEDSGLLKALGAAGAGLFPAAMLVRDEIEQRYGATLVAEVPSVTERFWGITIDRQVRHPLVQQVLDRARGVLAR